MPPSCTPIMSLEKIASELAIRNLVAEFANSATPPDYDNLLTLWTPDAHWTLSTPFAMEANGLEEIEKMSKDLLDPREFFVQFVHSGTVDVDGDNAKGNWILQEVARGPGETYYNNYAIYEDVYKQVNGKWLFAERHYKYIFLDDTSFPGESFPITREQ